MCDHCGCAATDGKRQLPADDGPQTFAVHENLLHENDRQADYNRQHFDQYGVFAVNLMSAPGSGKTSLLEATIDALPAGLRVAVIEGDLETENDAERIRRHGVQAVQITTGMACHLDARMVHHALHEIRLDRIDIVFIENVGNLVCPAGFDLGQHGQVLLLSVTEGDDKPAKYPVIFRTADQVLITKTDLLPHIEDFSVARARASIFAINGRLPVIECSAKNGDGIAGWLDWLGKGVAARRAALAG